MKTTKLRVAQVGAVMLAATMLAACGRPAEDPGTDASSSNPAPAQSGDVENATLTFWAMGDNGDKLGPVIEKFETENPGITVEVTSVPWQDAASKFQTAIAGGVTPDIAEVGTTLMGGITDAFAPVPSDFSTDIYFPGTLASAVVEGQTLGVPWTVDPRALYYRKDLAEQAGFTEAPKTWDELRQLAQAMKDNGVEWPIRFSTTPDQELQNALYFLWSAGGEITNAEQTEWTFDTPEAIEGYTFYNSLFVDGYADPNPEAGAGAAESTFVAGELGMFVAGSGEFSQLSEAGGDGFADKIGVAPFPKGPTSGTGFVGGSNLVVFNQSENSAAAWMFVKYLSEAQTQITWYQTAGGLPAVESAWDDPALAGDANLAVFGEQLGDTNSPPPVTNWLEVADVLGQQVEQMVKQGKTPEDMLADTQVAAAEIGTGR